MVIKLDFKDAINLANALVTSIKENDNSRTGCWGSKTVVVKNTKTKEYMVMSEWRAGWSLWWNNTDKNTKREIVKIEELIDLLEKVDTKDKDVLKEATNENKKTYISFANNLNTLANKTTNEDKLKEISEAIFAKYRPSTPDTIRCDNDERIHTEDQCLLDENQKKALEYFSTSHPCAALKFVSLTHEIKVPPKSGKLTSYITIGMCNEKGCYNATNQHRFPIIVNLFFYDPDFQNFTEFKKPTLTSSSFETNFEDIELPMNFF